MRYITVTSLEYAHELDSFFAESSKAYFPEVSFPCGGSVKIGFTQELEDLLISILADFTLNMIRPGELARFAELMPVDSRAGEAVVSRALSRLNETELLDSQKSIIAHELGSYLKDHSMVNAEGFVRFRLPLVIEQWAMAVDSAAGELLSLIGAAEAVPLFVSMLSPFSRGSQKELTVLLFCGGSCSVYSQNGSSACFDNCSEETLLLFIASLVPSLITVFDLTKGDSALPSLLQRVFGNRAVLFKISV